MLSPICRKGHNRERTGVCEPMTLCAVYTGGVGARDGSRFCTATRLHPDKRSLHNPFRNGGWRSERDRGMHQRIGWLPGPCEKWYHRVSQAVNQECHSDKSLSSPSGLVAVGRLPVPMVLMKAMKKAGKNVNSKMFSMPICILFAVVFAGPISSALSVAYSSPS